MTGKPIACTIASNNYLPFVRVLAKSFLEHHPGGRFLALMADRPSDRIDYDSEPFEVVWDRDLGIPGYLNMAFRYSILELNTALKPFFLAHLHRLTGCAQACYFDPDILILDGLESLFEKLGRADILLTPHVTQPLDDDRHPSEQDLLRAGIYNLGFVGIAFNPRTLDFLDWWGRRLHQYCLGRLDKGLFVDQKWMDLAPALLERAEIIHDPGLNVAYWNLAHRRPRFQDGRWLVSGEPLRFFHFSGFNPRSIEAVSKHQNRFALSDLPQLRPLFEGYAERLENEGYSEFIRLEYGYRVFSDGTPIPECAKRALQGIDPHGERWEDPFDAASPEGLPAWLSKPALRNLGLPKVALCLWDSEPELQRSYPLDSRAGVLAFAVWILNTGGRLHGIDQRFLQALAVSLNALPESLLSEASNAARADLKSVLTSSQPAAALARWISGLGDSAEIWLHTDAGLDDSFSGPLVNRLAMAIHMARLDLAQIYPQPLGRSRRDYAVWFVTHARLEYRLPPQAVAPVLSSLSWKDRMRAQAWWTAKRLSGAPPPQEAPAPSAPEQASRSSLSDGPDAIGWELRSGYHVAGYLKAPTGKGEECRGTLQALREAGIAHRGWEVRASDHGFDASEVQAAEQGSCNYAAALFHVNADMTPEALRDLPLALRLAERKIGYWDWELSHFPLAFAPSFTGLDEVWAPTRFCRDAYATLSPIPVRCVPPCVPPPASVERLSRSDLGSPEGSFLLANAFDARSVPERKNPQGLLKALALLREASSVPVHLLLKINHADEAPEWLAGLRESARGLPVTFVAEQRSRAWMNGLMAACDAYVSLHRSEGIGLPLIEAMYASKAVVATNYSGCVDFLDESTGWPVNYRLKTLQRNFGPYPAGAVWADADVEHAAACMLQCIQDPSDRVRRATRAQERVQELFSPQAAGARFALELDRIMGRKASSRP